MEQTFNITIDKELARYILEDIVTKNKADRKLLGEEWMDGYNSGYIDLLRVLEIDIEKIKEIAK